ncbi:GNAT family N-acetyltransferase [Agromyces endophyticus]|uniref:GNAT family N-acetyltransferase n=1 Tax=Agromyces sp. H17E-10 TaxID=2932244 RepID=UPI001FD1FF81|nr:GNAT family N-acetyltransferase [Agromyces sp. H17E-10]UOQ87917.1 GNAT family N-acetyltransferase [Agromyces sp. H17E-10]
MPAARPSSVASASISISISIEPPRQPEVERLLEGSTEYSRGLYPPEACFLLDVSQLERPGVHLYVARDGDGAAVGIAALVDGGVDGDADAPGATPPGRTKRGELKRMFVDPAGRGLGVAGALLARIEADAAERGIDEIVLETGPRHLPALALYEKHGYRRIEQFGPYVGEEFSVCLAKELARG